MEKTNEAPRTKGANHIGLTLQDYKGRTRRCARAAATMPLRARLSGRFFEYGIDPRRVIKLSGIGCSSKTPAYFLNARSGSTPSTGACHRSARERYWPTAIWSRSVSAATETLLPSGWGSSSHAAPEPPDDLHHGKQWRVRADQRPVLRHGRSRIDAEDGGSNDLAPLDCCIIAIELGCGMSRASFAGDPKQLVAAAEGALGHRGTAFLDVLSPCVTFNNHEGSTKSYKYLKDTEELLHEIGFVPFYEQISVDYPQGSMKVVELHDGSHITLNKLEREYDPADKAQALGKNP